MAGLTLDAGALIAAERDDARFWSVWRKALLRKAAVTVPSAVVAQVFRGPRSARIARLLQGCIVEPLDDRRSRAAGILLGKARTADVVDAAVVSSAATRGDDILTSDVEDLRHLATHVRGCGRILKI